MLRIVIALWSSTAGRDARNVKGCNLRRKTVNLDGLPSTSYAEAFISSIASRIAFFNHLRRSCSALLPTASTSYAEGPFFLGHERKHTDDPLPQRIDRYEASRGIAHAVKGDPRLRKALAQYLLFEYDLAGYETLTLAQLAERVEQEYKWEYGNSGFASSTRDVANALARIEIERESLRTMLTLALEIGTGHMRSRLAVNWLAHVQLRDPALQQVVERLRGMTLKVIWQQKMTYSSDNPEFLNVLRQGGSLNDNKN